MLGKTNPYANHENTNGGKHETEERRRTTALWYCFVFSSIRVFVIRMETSGTDDISRDLSAECFVENFGRIGGADESAKMDSNGPDRRGGSGRFGGKRSRQAPAGAPPKAAATAAAKPPAVVNGEIITKAELDAAVKQAGQSPVTLTEDQRRSQQMQVMGILIDEMLMKQFLAKNAPPVKPAEIDARVALITEELKKEKKTLADLFKEGDQTEAAFRADVGRTLQWEAYTKSKVSDADVERYYKENKDFFDKVMVRASHIVLRLPPNATDADKAKRSNS